MACPRLWECSWLGQMLWRGFLKQGKKYAIIYFSYVLWSFRPFSAAQIVSPFILFQNAPDCWFHHPHSFCGFAKTLQLLYVYLGFSTHQIQMFYLLNLSVNRETVNWLHLASLFNNHLSNYFWTSQNGALKAKTWLYFQNSLKVHCLI